MRYQDSDSKQRYETSQAYVTAMSNVGLQLNSQSILVQTEIQKPLLIYQQIYNFILKQIVQV